MLLVAIFLLALLTLSLSVAVPKVVKSLQRDRDLETFHRGMQYRRAVQLYYRKFHAYPPNADALVETNDIRFLRKKYIDPITNKADWKPVLFGQNKTPTAMGFFGQPLAGGATTIAGIGPGGGNGVSGSGGSPTSSPSGPSATGSNPTDTSGGTGGSTSLTGTTATGGPGSPTGSSTSSDQSGQTFGGAGIIGFSPASPKKSILIYKKKNHYNEWEFTYDPLSEMKTISGGNNGLNGQGSGSNQQNPTNTPTFGGQQPPPTATPTPGSSTQ